MATLSNNSLSFDTISKAASDFLEKLSIELQIPESRYIEAENRYHSVGKWLCRPESSLRQANPVVHIQGSFALGTVIRPVSEEEDYDIDMVSEFTIDISKFTQKQLKDAVFKELELYAEKYSMQVPEPHRRCVRLNYHEDAQFHADVTPAVPNGKAQRQLLKSMGIENNWIDVSVAITDNKHPLYAIQNPNWPNSNPRGYLKWFRSRMAGTFEQRRQALALAKKARVEDIPDYQIQTPLQLAIQILKRHRDMTHEGDPADRPISIIITTLAAQAYNGEPTIAGALYTILTRMHLFIDRKNSIAVISNPTDPNENFADKWREHPERETAFYDWMNKAKTDFQSILQDTDLESIGEIMSPLLGAKLVEKSVNASQKINKAGIIRRLWSLSNPTHKQEPLWPQLTKGQVVISSAMYAPKKGGFRLQPFKSGELALPKNCDLRFEATTNVPPPFQVFWQVVNTGQQARDGQGLRGGFDLGNIENGKLKRSESTRYRGTHTIECFIVKDNYCVAQSGQFIVNIQ